MTGLKGRKIILAVTGSIAAYKSLILVRLLTKADADVQVIMSRSAKEFVGKLSFATLSGKPVLSDLQTDQEWNNHVALGLWADLMIIAPASAHTISKLASGLVDNLLTAVYLSAKCPVMIAPAMDLDMWAHPATQSNIQTLQNFGQFIIPVGKGPLASGLNGLGRLAEPEDIFRVVSDHFTHSRIFENKKILITAGPTYEAIDPVRFIANHSSGKMGIRIAEQAVLMGAEVNLILGPSHEKIMAHPKLHINRIVSAEDMFLETKKHLESSSIFILAAAVADFKPEKAASEKIKKNNTDLQLKLMHTDDIAQFIGIEKKAHQFLVGFALETEQIIEHAKLKMEKKNMDFIVINSPRDENAAFGFDTNKISILHRDGRIKEFELKSKAAVAVDILLEIQTSINK
ncbi:MAG: bifunctional phosphopantothenoylcysteine decarboxylase/phosphopantothenate--cysteine ligase CoaBC [Bacteroidota bacterium]|nr:bifunctional phosphopantothenoylcysteine decarboxylase/phosphopantothenate--cysteine ligase CoaBC [Bacteroidota bacterium]